MAGANDASDLQRLTSGEEPEESTGKSWMRSLSPQDRKTIAGLHKARSWTWLKIALFILIWAAVGSLAIRFEALWVRLPCWIIIGFALHGLGVFMPAGAHGSLFRKPWLDRPIGFLSGVPVFLSCSSYRATHLLHHRYENTSKDPDNLMTNIPNPRLRTLVFYAWFIIGMPVYALLIIVTGPFRAQGLGNKLACVVEPILIGGIYYFLFTQATRHHFGAELANGWAWALPFAVLIANIRGLAEHTQLRQTEPPDLLKTTRALVSNRVVGFFLNNQNYHLEHHLFVGVPWNNLPKIHQVLQPLYQAQRASVVVGYGHWLVNALRYGPNRTLSYSNGKTVLE